jgi:hypothetical protein
MAYLLVARIDEVGEEGDDRAAVITRDTRAAMGDLHDHLAAVGLSRGELHKPLQHDKHGVCWLPLLEQFLAGVQFDYSSMCNDRFKNGLGQ